MDTLADFHFLRPLWLLAVIPAGLLVGSLLLQQARAVQWQKHIAPDLLPALIDGDSQKSSRGLVAAIAVLWGLCCIALAGPTWERQPTPVVQNADALVIAWDLSPSMLARDVTPSRLERSRLKIIDLLKSRSEGQTALIAYSAEAYTVTPLTDDIQTIINLLPALGPTTLPSVGSNPEMAFEQANELLNQAGITQGHIVMLTDEITSDALSNLRSQVTQSAHQLTLWGIGSQKGAPVPLPRGGFAKDGSGNMVLTRLNERELREFATQTSSYYVPVVTDGSDIQALETLLSATPRQDGDDALTERLFDQWLERGHWLIWLCLPLLALGFRRGWLMSWLVVIPLAYTPHEVEAVEAVEGNVPSTGGPSISRIFKTPNQQGFEHYQSEQFGNAAAAFEDPLWQGSAHYRAGNYEAAAKAFSGIDTANGHYNLGNAKLLGGNLEEAISAYQHALKQQPDFEEAKKNLAIAEQLKEQQEQQEEQQQNQDGQDNQENSEQQSDQEQSDQNQNSSEHNDEQQQSQQQSGESEQDQGEPNSEPQPADSDPGDADPSDAEPAEAQQQAQNSEGNASSESAMAGENTSGASSSEGDSLAQKLAQESTDEPMSEEEQMIEQVLRKVPDDPAGLLRNKFQYQYKQRQQELRSGYNQTQDAEQRW